MHQCRYQIKRQIISNIRSSSSSSKILKTCPFSGRKAIGNSVDGIKAHEESSSSSSAAAAKNPTYFKVPSLPYLGSVGATTYSGMPPLDFSKLYDFLPEMRRRFGNFYSFGFPGLGSKNDSHGTIYVTCDPNEMLKVVRNQGPLPQGLISQQWGMIKWNKDKNFEIVAEEDGLFGQGVHWKRLRNFFQTDLLSPAAAKGYIPGIIEAAQLASRGAPASADNMNYFLNCCAFDLFNTVMFGELTEVADTVSPTDPDNLEFVNSALGGLANGVQLLASPYQVIIGRELGIETKQYKTMAKNFEAAWEIGKKKIDVFMQKFAEDSLNDNQKASYLARAINRQQKDEMVSVREMQELCFAGLFVAVDTTSSVLSWNLLHIATNSDIQEKVYEELSSLALSSADGRKKLNPEMFEKSQMPYFNAVLRETQRMTPSALLALKKTLLDDMEICGRNIPKGSVLMLDSHSVGMDPDNVHDPDTYNPNRWLPDAVEGRKGSSAAVLDHPYARDEFGQGARRCPGSRVAMTEVSVMLSQLILDWKITTEPVIDSWKDVKYESQTMVVPELPTLQFEPRT